MNLKLLSFSLLFLVMGNLLSYSQDITVTGTVTSSVDNLPLPGANIILRNGSTGVVTDFDGQYGISVPTGSVLVYSYQGFKTIEVAIRSQNIVDVALEEDVANLDEVVLIGYGSSTKKDLTGSISSIKSDDLGSVKVTTPDEFVQGRVPGLVMTQTSGQPGAASSVRIRGSSSILASNEPLYVIDGFPVDNNSNNLSSGFADGPSMNALSIISPSDIESIDVLKDASATAIYGSRGANGVIIITTKRGNRGKVQINYDTYLGIQKVSNKIDLLDASQFAYYLNEANFNAGQPRTYTDPSSFGKGTDWQDELFRDAIVENHDISIKGGGDKVKYAVMASYLDQEGVIINSDFQRYSLRTNLDFNATDKLLIENSFSLNRSQFSTANTEAIGSTFSSSVISAYSFSPMLPVYDANGDYTLGNFVVNDDGSFDNSQGNANFQNGNPGLISPIAYSNLTDSKGRVTRIMENLAVTWNMMPNLSFKSSLGVDLVLNEEQLFRTAKFDFQNPYEATGQKNKRLATNLLMEATLNYKNTFNNKHRIDALVGISKQNFGIDELSAVVIGFPVENFGADNLGMGSDQGVHSNIIESVLLSYMGRVNYVYDNRFMLTATTRLDGSSKFGADQKYGLFPSGAFAWSLSEEEFIKDLHLFSYLKLRLGYGMIGNESINPYSALSTYRNTYHYFGNVPAQGQLPISPANNNLKWELTEQYNVGLDMNFFNDRLSVTADVYQKNTKDLLLSLQVPWQTGYSDAIVNVGDVRNSGAELAINTQNFKGAFTWSTNLSVAYNKNEILNLAGLDEIPTGFGMQGISNWQLLVEGGEIGAFYGYVSDGIVQLDDDISTLPTFAGEVLVPGERKYKDLNNDGIIDPDGDRTFLGNPLPEFSFGINNSFSWKNFDLNVFLQGVAGNEIVNFNRYSIEGMNGLSNVTVEAFSNRWTPQNPSNTYTRAYSNKFGATPRIARFSDHYVESGDYLRFKSLTLGYTLPSQVSSKMNINKLRLYVTGRNLFTLTEYSGVDPEVSVGGQNNNLSAGGDFGGYPSTRTFLLGLNLNF